MAAEIGRISLLMHEAGKKWAMFALRWGIAVAGIWWVVSNMSWRDHIWVLDERNLPRRAVLAEPAVETAPNFVLDEVDLKTGHNRVVFRQQVINRPDKAVWLTIETGEGSASRQLVGLDLNEQLSRVNRLLVSDGERGEWVAPERVVGGYTLRVPHPRLEVGVSTLLKLADPGGLAAAVAIFPIVFVITAIRWNMLLRAMDIALRLGRTFVLEMVGAFYSTFMLGSTGGDVLRAYYASRHTTHRTRAVLSVLVDRAIGLMALVILGGVTAAGLYFLADSPKGSAARACGQIALGAAAMVVGAAAGIFVLTHPGVRRALGVDFILNRLPLQKHVQLVVEGMRMYRQRPALMVSCLVMTFPVHLIVVTSAALAGTAFGLPLPPAYYYAIVPVIVLAGAVPISPQGVGVMEFFAILLTRQYGTTVSQAFALTMSIRLVQMLWNLTGGLFVFRGGYHAPTATEQRELETDDEAAISPA